MHTDGTNTKPTMPATISKLKSARQVLWAILGLKMAIDRLTELKIDVVADSGNNGTDATIKVHFGNLRVDLSSGRVNDRDMNDAIVALTKKLEEVSDEK